METIDIVKYYLILFFMGVIAIITVNLIRETEGIINNGNILTNGRCYKNCK